MAKNVAFVKGLGLIIEGLSVIRDSMSDGAMSEHMNAPVVEEEETVVSGDVKSRKELEEMKYNELKKYGASLGVKCTGTRDDIIDRILALAGDTSEEEETEEEVEEEVEVSEDEEVEEDSDEEEEDSDEDEDDGKAEEDADEDEEESDDDDEESEEEDDEEDSDGEEVDENTYFDYADIDGLNDPNDATKKRLKAMVTVQKKILSDYENDKVTLDDMNEFLDTFLTAEEKEQYDDEDEDSVVPLYIETKKRLIDDDGITHEGEDPYEINGKAICCAHPLVYDKKHKTYTCAVCSSEYDDEE